MTGYARDEELAGRRAARAVRFVSLLVLPAHLGLAAVSAALVYVAYGPAYAPAIPAVAIVALLAIPKAFFWMPSTIYKAADRQTILLRYLAIAAVINLALDWVLIPSFGPIAATRTGIGCRLGSAQLSCFPEMVPRVAPGRWGGDDCRFDSLADAGPEAVARSIELCVAGNAASCRRCGGTPHGVGLAKHR
jgi:hypothetical protein